MKKLYLIAATLLLTLPVAAQDDTTDPMTVEPIQSARLRGPREASEAEKAYARQLAQEREEQQQIDMNLPVVDENGQVQTPATDYYYPFWGGYGWNSWRLHKGLNVNLGASAFVTSGHGTHAGFTQDVSLMYVTNLSKKATLAVGGYINNLIYRGDNYTTAGISALFGYRFNEHWSAYAFVQKAFTSDNIYPLMGYGRPYWGGYYGYGYARAVGMSYGPWDNRFMDRIGGGVTYEWGEHNQNSISIQVEYDHMPEQRGNFYNTRRYDYPVR